ncbi:MAG: T9SS type A sorting domain-containing protein [Flavobacterium sp.]
MAIQEHGLPTLDNTITTIYTFTPDAGQCVSSTTLTITVNQPVIPTFTAVAPICNGQSLAALPTTSTNGYTGSWSPALDNTTTTTYTFTPDAGQCAASTTLVITVNQPTTTPTFTAIAPICNGGTLTLPTTSNNGISGVWSPVADNTATTTYTFTPDAGQCGVTTTLTVTVNQPVTPAFTAIAPICSGEALTLPTTSNNGINGTWSPAIDNTVTTTYTFTPNSGECAANGVTLTITVNQPTVPAFTAVAAICNGDALAALPTTSNNGITGTWAPALDNTATTTYTFTPDAGQCAATATMIITVHTTATPTGNAFQVFEVADLSDATIADLVVNPTDVNWYGSLADAQSLNNPPLPLTTVLTNGTTYYAVAFSATCPSQPFAVTVTVSLDNDDFDAVHFNYYPNPTSSIVNISYSKNITQVTLINMLGQIISIEKTNSTHVQVDLSRLAEATYFVKVASDGKEKIIKVIKQR